MASIFSKIVAGVIPCHKIYEDENYFAFLDINPLQKGHVLVIPKEETDYIYDLDDTILAGLMLCSKKIAIAIKKAFPCDRIGVAVIGLEVPHTHIHLIPINTMSDMDFTNKKLQLSQEELASVANTIQSAL